MLVLSRKVGEKIRVGDNVVFSINRINGNQVTVGIEAPRDIAIVRDELPPDDVAPADVRRPVQPAA